MADRKLNDDERRMIVAALLGARAQALQVASCWDPENGNIPKTLGLDGAEMHRNMLALAQEQQRLAHDIIDPSFDLTLAKRP